MVAPVLPTALDQLLMKQVAVDGELVVPTRPTVNFTGDGVRVEDDPDNEQTTVTIRGGSAPVISVVAKTNVALTGLQTIDGYTLQDGDGVLPTAQTDGTESRPWVARAGAWESILLADGDHAAGATIFVDRGYYERKTSWVCRSDYGSDVVGEDTLTWRCVQTLRDDFDFDASDLAYYFVDETGPVATVANRVTGGASLPLQAWTSGVGDVTRSAQYFTPGPFGGTAGWLNQAVDGWYGADAALDCPNTVHLSFFFKPLHYFNATAAGTDTPIVGRTRVNKATTFSSATVIAADLALALTGRLGSNLHDDGSSSDHVRRLLANVTVAGTLRTLDVVTASQNNLNQLAPIASRWSQVDVIRDNADGNIFVYVNGVYRSTGTFAGSVSGTGAGYWFVGLPVGSTGMWNFPMLISRLRIMNANRGQAWITERNRRMAAWVGG